MAKDQRPLHGLHPDTVLRVACLSNVCCNGTSGWSYIRVVADFGDYGFVEEGKRLRFSRSYFFGGAKFMDSSQLHNQCRVTCGSQVGYGALGLEYGHDQNQKHGTISRT